LADTSANQFVTIFYGVLDPVAGSLVYCNAGQWPPHLFIGGKNGTAKRLTRTALPLGILEDAGCGRGVVELGPGNVLVLYTDGITEAQDDAEALYGEERLMATVRASLGGSAQAIRDAITEDVRGFIGDAPQLDDIALAVLVREPALG
jgi:sigma-B regulation protein RsbU (phosphoserine phosphatase)